MKLYFYILETTREGNPVLKIEESEVIEKHSMWYPTSGRYSKGDYNFVQKCEIGCISGWNKNRVVLDKPDLELAKQLFTTYINKERKHHEAMAKLWEEKLEAVKNATDRKGEEK